MTSHSSNEYNRNWRREHREQARATYRAWYKKNKEKVITKVRKYQDEHKEVRRPEVLVSDYYIIKHKRKYPMQLRLVN